MACFEDLLHFFKSISLSGIEFKVMDGSAPSLPLDPETWRDEQGGILAHAWMQTIGAGVFVHSCTEKFATVASLEFTVGIRLEAMSRIYCGICACSQGSHFNATS